MLILAKYKKLYDTNNIFYNKNQRFQENFKFLGLTLHILHILTFLLQCGW